ncbi:TPA: hypothetical protein L5Q86_006341 [Pseudomonas aeruginosa]|nr:hypothetical protein [Pseudomonas aeruginosa]
MFKPNSGVIWSSTDSDGPGPVLVTVVGPVKPAEYDHQEVEPMFTILMPNGVTGTAFADELDAADAAPDFHAMSRAELSVWYVEHVGYDLGEDDSAMTLEDFRQQCGEMYAQHALTEA